MGRQGRAGRCCRRRSGRAWSKRRDSLAKTVGTARRGRTVPERGGGRGKGGPRGAGKRGRQPKVLEAIEPAQDPEQSLETRACGPKGGVSAADILAGELTSP
jgi:hypothetical protein